MDFFYEKSKKKLRNYGYVCLLIVVCMRAACYTYTHKIRILFLVIGANVMHVLYYTLRFDATFCLLRFEEIEANW